MAYIYFQTCFMHQKQSSHLYILMKVSVFSAFDCNVMKGVAQWRL